MAKIFNKKKVLLALASAAMCVCAVLGAGCKKEVEQISITKSNTPQTVYVQGNDLNLSEGVLTVVIDGEKSEISLTDPEVSVTGYDSTKLGEQTLTITYGEKMTTLKVTVVPRIQVVKEEGAYFVGETFDKSKGDITITYENGETTNVSMDDESITVTGFDSSVANAELPLTITYQKDDVTYTGTFNVTVYAVEDVEFRSPNKKAYENHEKDLDVTGGYIALKNGDFSRYVQLTTDMVSGFDLSEATVEHRTEPLKQTLTVNYCGQQKTYEIQIKFSDLSLINLRASELSGLNWTSSDLPSACTTEMGENALEAMQVYFKMEDKDIVQIGDGNVDIVAKVAAVYGLEKWEEAFASYSDAFYLTEQGGLAWNCEDFNKTQTAYQSILNKDPVLYEDAPILLTIKEKFETLVIHGEDTVGALLAAVYQPETIDAFAEQLKLMIDLHNALKDVPTNWTLASLKADYADEIQAAWVVLRESKFKKIEHRSLYFLASRWREKNDYFEILYTYFYDAEDFDKINDIKDLRLPGELETMYQIILAIRSQIVGMQQGYVLESTNFIANYDVAVAKRAEILKSNDAMILDLYGRLKFDYLIGNGNGGYTLVSFDDLLNQFRRSPMGYLHHFGAYLGVKTSEDLWKEFSKVLQKAGTTESYMESAEFAADAQGLLRAYLSLSPKQQFAFMGMLHPYYIPTAAGRFPLYAWENDGDGFQNQFTYLIYTYYESVLPEEAHDIFTELMLASEALANLQLTTSITTFFEHMDNVASMSERLSKRNEQAWESFNTIAGWVLLEMETYETKFEGLKQEGGTLKRETLTNGQLKDFEDLLNATYEAYAMMMTYQAFLQQGKANLAIAFYAPMEKVEKLSAKILSSGDPNVLRAYYFDEFVLQNVTMPDKSVVNFGGSMDTIVFMIRDVYTDALTGMSYLTASDLMYDAYNRIDVKDYLANSTYLYFTYIYMNLVPSTDVGYIYFQDVDTMMQIAKDFRSTLTDEERYFVLVLDANFQMYRNAMSRFGKERNSEMATLVNQLLMVEYMSVFYKQLPDGKDEDGKTYKEMLLEEYETLLEDYAELKADVEAEAAKDTPDQKLLNAMNDFNTYFGEMFEHYKTLCDSLKTA